MHNSRKYFNANYLIKTLQYFEEKAQEWNITSIKIFLTPHWFEKSKELIAKYKNGLIMFYKLKWHLVEICDHAYDWEKSKQKRKAFVITNNKFGAYFEKEMFSDVIRNNPNKIPIQ